MGPYGIWNTIYVDKWPKSYRLGSFILSVQSVRYHPWGHSATFLEGFVSWFTVTLANPASTIILDVFKNPTQMVLSMSDLSHLFSWSLEYQLFPLHILNFIQLSEHYYLFSTSLLFPYPPLRIVLFYCNLLSTDSTVLSHLRALLPSLPRLNSKISHDKQSCAETLNSQLLIIYYGLTQISTLFPFSVFLLLPVFCPFRFSTHQLAWNFLQADDSTAERGSSYSYK